MRKALLIINPSSGSEKAKKYEQQTQRKLAEFFDEVTIKYTQKAGDAACFAREACARRFHSVFVMGGVVR